MNVLRRREVIKKTGLSRDTIRRKVVAGEFPRPITLGPQAVGWIESEVDDWIAARAAERDAPEPKAA